jgi:hypothetical protein
VIAVALTGQEPRAGFPLTLESGASGLPKRSWIKISEIRTLAVERIGRRISRAPEEELERVIDGLNEDTALRLGRLLKTSPQFWMRLQADWDLHEAMQRQVRAAS